MGFLSTTDILVGGSAVLIGAVGSLLLSRKIHKLIAGGSTRGNRPRWFAANGAGISFFVVGLAKSPGLLVELSRFVGGDDGQIGPIGADLSVLASATAVGAGIGFIIGKLKS